MKEDYEILNNSTLINSAVSDAIPERLNKKIISDLKSEIIIAFFEEVKKQIDGIKNEGTKIARKKIYWY